MTTRLSLFPKGGGRFNCHHSVTAQSSIMASISSATQSQVLVCLIFAASKCEALELLNESVLPGPEFFSLDRTTIVVKQGDKDVIFFHRSPPLP